MAYVTMRREVLEYCRHFHCQFDEVDCKLALDVSRYQNVLARARNRSQVANTRGIGEPV